MYRIDRIFLSPSVRQSVSGVVRHACHELAGVNMDVQDGGDFALTLALSQGERGFMPPSP